MRFVESESGEELFVRFAPFLFDSGSKPMSLVCGVWVDVGKVACCLVCVLAGEGGRRGGRNTGWKSMRCVVFVPQSLFV